MSTVTQVSPTGKPLSELLDEVYGTSTAQAAREEWAAAVHTVASKAKEVLPESHTRVDKATKIVLADGVELVDGNKAKITSQGKEGMVYHIANGMCDCEDYEYRAPSGWCKHRLAKALYLRAARMIEDTTAAMAAIPATPVEPPAALPLPEAPASANVHIMIGGRQVQVTLRDVNETQLLGRLNALLAQFPVETPATPAATPEGWCALHNVQMRHNQKDGRSWYSHKYQDGWCKGK